MIDNDEVDAFLEHYGVRGMRWGTRKANARGDKKTIKERMGQENSTFTKGQKKAAVAVAAGLGTAAIIGGVAAKHYLSSKGSVPVKDIYKVSQKALDRDRAANLIGIHAKEKMARIQVAKQAGRITEDQQKRLLGLLSRDTSNAYADFHGFLRK